MLNCHLTESILNNRYGTLSAVPVTVYTYDADRSLDTRLSDFTASHAIKLLYRITIKEIDTLNVIEYQNRLT
jgi:hypothetical protein